MVSTIQIKPAPLLEPYVSCYALRKFNTGKTVLPKPLYALHECYMTFFLKDEFCDMINEAGNIVYKWSSNIYCLFTQPSGCSYYRGDFILFSVQFKTNGFFAVFGIPQKTLINIIVSAEDILGDDYRVLMGQLKSCKHIAEMGRFIDTYLTRKLLCQKHKVYTEIIACVSNIILRNKGVVSLDKLASYANMSLRNFERRFSDEVGMPPKLYCRITRFYNALENKMLHPYKSWKDISYENGYFDHAHLIKEVTSFSSKTPTELFKDTPPPVENFITKIEH
jgi:AraC-like DNA-binding protein